MEETLNIAEPNIEKSQIKPNILLVDDRPENLVALERLLENLPVNLFKANSGNEALRLTLHHDFALALLDIQMPEMDGYELAGYLREEEKTQHMPFIFISAIYTDSINVFEGYEKGAFSYITKPFEPEVLINKVKFFIEKHQQEIALKENTTQLQAINEELKSFTYSVSHDLRAPLRAIDGFCKVLDKKAANQLEDSQRRYLNLIIQNVSRMQQLIEDLLSFSRTSRQEKNIVEIDTRQLINEVLEEESMAWPNIDLDFRLGETPEIVADRVLMKQVFKNLVGNAIKYSSKEDKVIVEIKGYTDGDQITYYVKDNGVGFDEEYANKLFMIFQRLHNDEDFEGTGLGLAIVKRIITKHDGRVWAESQEGQGATFYFSLPQRKS